MPKKLIITELSISKEGKQLFDPVNLELENSFFLGIVGANGVGKSTLANCLLGKQKFSGNILLPCTTDKIGYLSQSQNLTFDLIVKDLVVMGLYTTLKQFESYHTKHFKRVLQQLRALKIDHLYLRNFNTLSGGEQQLVWLAQTLIKEPELIILDEPTSSLDIHNKTLLFSHLQRLHTTAGISIICITHDIYLLKKIKGMLLTLSKDKSTFSKITPSVIDNFYDID